MHSKIKQKFSHLVKFYLPGLTGQKGDTGPAGPPGPTAGGWCTLGGGGPHVQLLLEHNSSTQEGLLEAGGATVEMELTIFAYLTTRTIWVIQMVDKWVVLVYMVQNTKHMTMAHSLQLLTTMSHVQCAMLQPGRQWWWYLEGLCALPHGFMNTMATLWQTMIPSIAQNLNALIAVHRIFPAVQAEQMELSSTMLKLNVMAYALLTQMEESSHALCVPSNSKVVH